MPEESAYQEGDVLIVEHSNIKCVHTLGSIPLPNLSSSPVVFDQHLPDGCDKIILQKREIQTLTVLENSDCNCSFEKVAYSC